MNKNKISERICEIDVSYVNLDDVIKKLASIKKIHSKKYDSFELIKEQGEAYDDCYYVYIYGYRDENKEEMKKREDQEKQRQEWRRQEFERLKQEFEGKK